MGLAPQTAAYPLMASSAQPVQSVRTGRRRPRESGSACRASLRHDRVPRRRGARGAPSEPGDWVLPSGNPEPREGVLACARREVREETGLDVDPGRCAFVLETIDPSGEQRVIEVVFLSPDRPAAQPVGSEPGMEPEFVPLSQLGELPLRPPLAGHIRALHSCRHRATAPYLGNLWRAGNGVLER
jgi:8-oxo-dGTP diphosphatase